MMIKTRHIQKLMQAVCMGLLVCSLTGCSRESKISRVQADDLNWPAQTSQTRPWARWWWMGSAVNEKDLTALLTQYQEGGLGGVEICPVYGAKGYENQFIDFLSPQWMKMLVHTTREAQRLGLGVDMTAGTGWPFGGPWITERSASSGVILKKYELSEGKTITGPLTEGRLQYLLAVSDTNQRIDLTGHVKDGRLDWTVPQGNWRLYAVSQKGPMQRVKRAAPGGVGSVVDPYSVLALDNYLMPFDTAFTDYPTQMPRCFFQDSFEYFGATWTNSFFAQFKLRRGYDLRTQIEALFGDGDEEIVARVQSDYRRTISDLHLAFVRRWTEWSHLHGSLTREQAHGAPANLLDLYAAVDIPDTEIFREVDNRQIPLLGFAASSAHLKGNSLVAAESFTWLKNHFQTSLVDVKEAADFLFISGVNHIFFHGIPYSPPQAPWPGWQFYASVNFSPTGGLWHDLPAFNAYVSRCQSILQSGNSGNEILLYFPIDDIWHTTDDLSMPFTIHTDGRSGSQKKWLWSTPFYKAAMMLHDRGYPADYISDTFVQQARCKNGKIELNGNRYSVLIVPTCQKMPIETMEQLIKLAKAGAKIIFESNPPTDVPGFEQYQKRQAEMQKLLRRIRFDRKEQAAIARVSMGKGLWIQGPIEETLSAAGIVREPMADEGLQFIRRTHSDGWYYFVVNPKDKPFDGWLTLGNAAQSVVFLDPYFDNQIGLARIRKSDDGKTEAYMQLKPGQSCILRTFADKNVNGPAWDYWHQEKAVPVEGVWKVEFIDGGPARPKAYDTVWLSSWTTWPDVETRRFAGTARYTMEFTLAEENTDGRLLDLGQVCDSARVTANGRFVGILWSRPYQINIGPYLHSGKNTLQVEVTNVAANRIRDMDFQKVQWKYFYDSNVLDTGYKPFDASGWPLRDSGLLGPVNLISLKKI